MSALNVLSGKDPMSPTKATPKKTKKLKVIDVSKKMPRKK
jgi:hypothetical protein